VTKKQIFSNEVSLVVDEKQEIVYDNNSLILAVFLVFRLRLGRRRGGQQMKKRENASRLGLSILYTGLILLCIFQFSQQIGSDSAGLSQRVLDFLLGLFPGLGTWLPRETVHALLRKGAHVLVYTLLGLGLYQLADAALPPKCWGRGLLLPWAVGVLCAAGDEFHQSFVAGRGASPRDVLIDSCGLLLGLLLSRAATSLWRSFKRRRQKT